MKRETAKTLTMVMIVSFAFIAVSWLAMLAMLLITWLGGIV